MVWTHHEQRYPCTSRTACAAAALSLTLLLAASGCCLTTKGVAAAPPLPPEGRDQFGTFERVRGVGVLMLRGTPHHRGRAHGKLLARGVLEMVDTVCGSNLLLSRRSDYERVILPLVARFRFTPDEEAELRGILDGVRMALGDEAVLERLGRPLRLEDLKAYNTAGDWYRQGCSTFAAWGKNTEDGHVWVGRNFDFLPARAFFTHQMIVVHEASGGRKAWASVSSPGMIGCITGINGDGVFGSVHDVFLPLRPLDGEYVPRLLVLRRLMETCGARDLERQALPILRSSRQMFDNSIFLAAPVTDGTTQALVFEYDGDQSKEGGVTVRRPGDDEGRYGREMIGCTNHFLKRVRPGVNPLRYRYPLMARVVAAKGKRGEKVDFDVARKTMGAVRLPITVHTVIADLSAMEFWYAAGEYLSPPGKGDYVRLPMKDWLMPPGKR
jgi:hypothetical protein